MHYFDASALLKRYVREAGSAKVRRRLAEALPATCRFSAVEIASALMRRRREGALTDEERDRAMVALTADMAALLVAELTPAMVERAQGLLQKHPLRAGDAVQLASALFLQEQLGEPVTFHAFDDRLVEAARLEGLTLG